MLRPAPILVRLSPSALVLALAVASAPLASEARSPADDQGAAPTASEAAGAIMPLYAVDLDLLAGGDAKPSPAAVQAWSLLRPAGFGAIRFRVDVAQPEAAGRDLAALCAWADTEGVSLVPVWTASPGKPLPSSFAGSLAAAQKALVAAMSATGEGWTARYSRLAMYQIGEPLNHRGRWGGMPADAAQLRAAQAAATLRRAELDALADSGLEATPILAPASFDFELVRAGRMAGGTLDDAGFAAARDGLLDFLRPLVAAPDIDAVGVEWLAGSVTPGAPDRFQVLIAAVSERAPGKTVVLSTSASSAFGTDSQKADFHRLTFLNLADFRAQPAGETLGGLVFRGTPVGSDPVPAPAALRKTVAGWKAASQAAELGRQWTAGAASGDLARWLGAIDAGSGLLARSGSGLRETDALQALVEVAGAAAAVQAATPTDVADGVAGGEGGEGGEAGAPGDEGGEAGGEGDEGGVSDAAGTTDEQGGEGGDVTGAPVDAGGEAGDAGATPESQGGAVGTAVEEHVAQGLGSLIDRLFDKLGSKVSGGGAEGGAADPGLGGAEDVGPGGAGAPPSIALSGADVRLGATPVAGQPTTVDVDLRNTGAGQAEALVVTLAAAGEVQSQLADVGVAPGEKSTVALEWTPVAAGATTLAVEVWDASLTLKLAAASRGGVNVGSGEPASPGSPGGVKVRPGLLKARLPVGLPELQALNVGAAKKGGAAYLAPVQVTLRNPYAFAMQGVEVKLESGGRTLATRTVKLLAPRQVRSLAFGSLPFGGLGPAEVTARVSRGGKRPLKGSSVLRVTLATTALTPTRTPVRGVGSGRAPARPVRTTRPVVVRPRVVVRPSPTPVPRGPLVVGRPVSPALFPDAAIGAGDFTQSPSPAAPGQVVKLVVRVRNQGTGPIRGGRVALLLSSGGRLVAQQQFGIDDLPARALRAVSWTVRLPNAVDLRLEARASVAGDRHSGNDRAVWTLSVRRAVTPRVPPRRLPPIRRP